MAIDDSTEAYTKRVEQRNIELANRMINTRNTLSELLSTNTQHIKWDVGFETLNKSTFTRECPHCKCVMTEAAYQQINALDPAIQHEAVNNLHSPDCFITKMRQTLERIYVVILDM
jgi:ATP-dependent 26S proteasome regulatory subunit